MKKVFISVPMSGREEIDVRNDIKRASENIRKLYGEDVEIVHNYDCVAPDNAERLYYLGEAIKQLGECNACYFVRNWECSNGCLIERMVCDVDPHLFDIILESNTDNHIVLKDGLWLNVNTGMMI